MQKIHSFYNLDYTIVLQNLHTSTDGLTKEEVARRQQEYGKNVFHRQKRYTVFKTFFSQFLSPLVFVLIFASIITIYLQESLETMVIWSAILINVLFSTYQEYKAEHTIEQLQKLIKNKALVKREALTQEIEAEDLTIGDIVILQYGAQVPADIRLIHTNDLKIDEAILTGESVPVEKHTDIVTEHTLSERKNYAFSGTHITNGNGIGVVTHIGAHTEVGRIAESIMHTKKTRTPVQNAIHKISWYVFSIALCVLVFILILGVYKGENVFEMLILASAVAVGAVPEALPIALTVILSIGVLHISKKGGLIRKLSAAETLGSTTLILTDKTGTLTEGNLTLEHIIPFDQIETLATQGFDPNQLDHTQKHILAKAVHNFSVTIDKASDDRQSWKYKGNAFEVILTKIANSHEIHIPEEQHIVVPFNSTNKYSVSKHTDTYTLLGAPDILIKHADLTEDTKNTYIEKINTLSNQGKRIVAIAEKKGRTFSLHNIRLVGIFVFSDVLRSGIQDSIRDIVAKGVQVKIMTGDLPGTAVYIGKQIGIDTAPEEVLTSSQIAGLTDADLIQIIPRIKIFARVTPEDKLRIGRLYQSLGEVVAMTGDGVNDAPALKAMDIGISLSSGSEVAKSAADMILLRDNFETIADTISVGHTIKKNIQKVFVYLMSNSLDAVFVVTGSLIFGLTLPLTALQIIWVNILTGTLPALAFAYDTNRGRSRTSKNIFDNKVKFLALGIGTLSSILLFTLYYVLSLHIQNTPLVQSIFFLCFSTYILTISYSFMDLEQHVWMYNPFSNWRLNTGVSIGFILISMTVYTSIGQRIFNLIAVPPTYLWILAGWLVCNIWIIEFSKYIYKKR